MEASNTLKSLIESKKEELNSIDKSLITNMNIIIESIEQKNNNEQIEEYKKLIISKDNEISKLNGINSSKENEINELNKKIEELKNNSGLKELEDNYKKEKENLLSKINNLELKKKIIYSLNEEKNKIK